LKSVENNNNFNNKMERQLHLFDNSEYCKGSSDFGQALDFAWLIDPVAIDRNL
jgi:hypothetical protein